MSTQAYCSYIVFENQAHKSSRYTCLSSTLLHQTIIQQLDPATIPEIRQALPKVELQWLCKWLEQVYAGKANYGICHLS